MVYTVFLLAMAGWGLEVFTYSYHWWVVPILATHLGAVLGAWVYYLAIGRSTTGSCLLFLLFQSSTGPRKILMQKSTMEWIQLMQR